MPVFYALVVLGAGLFWLLASGLYRPLGKLFARIIRDVIDTINFEEDNKK